MSNVTQDKWQLAKAKFLDQISVKEGEIRALRDKLALIDEVENIVKDIKNEATSTTQKYAGVKLTKAVLEAVQILGTNGGISATDVRQYIAANGYKHPNPKNFGVATVVALTRLGENDKIISEKVGGKRIFKRKM